ncbi:MAG: DUF2087 domain-containing protein [Chloroflexota bacterium]
MASNTELKNHLDSEGRLIFWPSKRTLQLVALDYLATKIGSGRVYTEKEVNALLNSWHTFGDPALLLRELHERGLLNRHNDGAEYWRTLNTKFIE